MKKLLLRIISLLVLMSVFTILYLAGCGDGLGDEDDADEDDDSYDDDSDSDDDDDDDDDDSIEGCGTGTWGFVEERFDTEDIIYVWAGFPGYGSTGSMEKPFKTIKSGLKAAVDNGFHALAVSDGTYKESFDLEDRTSPAWEMKIVGRCPELTTIDNSEDRAVVINNPSTEFSYFSVVGHGSCAICIMADDCSVINNNVIKGSGGQTGIRITNGSGGVSGNEITDFTKHQILVTQTSGMLQIINNHISSSYSKPGFGILVDDSEDVKILSNEITNLTGYGIFIQNQSEVTVSKNTLTNASEVGIQFNESEGTAEENMLSWTKAPKSSPLYGDGIVIFNTLDVVLSGNQIQGVGRAAVIADFTEGMIELNKLASSIFGLVVQNRSDVQLESNTMTGNDYNQFSFPVRLLEIQDQRVEF